jgi:hypothetical protein
MADRPIENNSTTVTSNNAFCILPWIHLHTYPDGTALPCCIADHNYPMGSTRTDSINQLINSDGMKKLRVDMLNGVQNPVCNRCYIHEQTRQNSARQDYNITYEKYISPSLKNTNTDGFITDFKMRRFDIRFSNLCNFKCRTCNSVFSSQWEIEDKKEQLPWARSIPKNDRTELLQEIFEHIPYIEEAYFAGGEPLITEEHYIILEEMIRQGRTDTILRYNSNISNLKFKGRDILNLWSKFTKVIIGASVDHYGKRAEYIRHGTKWNEVEENIRTLRAFSQLEFSLNTVVSIYNFVTLADFYHYLLDHSLYTAQDYTYTTWWLTGPDEYSATLLSPALKKLGQDKLDYLIVRMKKLGFNSYILNQLEEIKLCVNNNIKDPVFLEKFRSETARLDKFRQEKFKQVFPELVELL